MRAAVRKWKAVFGIYFQDGLAYRASGIIWILTDLVTAITMPLVWASASGGGSIAGFGSSDFVAYYLALFAINSFVTSHIMWELAMEIREGRFTVFLLRPISFYWFTFLRNLSFLADVTIQPTWEFWAALAGGHLVSITFVLMMSMIALFTQEAQSIFELYYVPMSFLSGYLFPIALLPEWARSLAHFFPFYYTTGAPTEILLGRMDRAGAHNVLLIQAAWIVGCYLAAQVLWKKGLRHYTAIGM
jgi:ABC-2 type transport system permease protein